MKNFHLIIINLFFKTFFLNYVYMMNLSLYIFGAIYIIRGKLAPVVGSTQGKPFGWGPSPCNDRNLKSSPQNMRKIDEIYDKLPKY